MKSRAARVAWKAMMASNLIQIPVAFYSGTSLGIDPYLPDALQKAASISFVLGGVGFSLFSIDKSPAISKSNWLHEDNALFTGASHSIIRHPIYSGFRAASLGFAVLNPTLEALLATGAVFATTEITARLEERDLERTLGDAYRSYAARVPRWIPKGRYLAEDEKDF